MRTLLVRSETVVHAVCGLSTSIHSLPRADGQLPVELHCAVRAGTGAYGGKGGGGGEGRGGGETGERGGVAGSWCSYARSDRISQKALPNQSAASGAAFGSSTKPSQVARLVSTEQSMTSGPPRELGFHAKEGDVLWSSRSMFELPLPA